jgi:hypothetical protein
MARGHSTWQKRWGRAECERAVQVRACMDDQHSMWLWPTSPVLREETQPLAPYVHMAGVGVPLPPLQGQPPP